MQILKRFNAILCTQQYLRMTHSIYHSTVYVATHFHYRIYSINYRFHAMNAAGIELNIFTLICERGYLYSQQIAEVLVHTDT